MTETAVDENLENTQLPNTKMNGSKHLRAQSLKQRGSKSHIDTDDHRFLRMNRSLLDDDEDEETAQGVLAPLSHFTRSGVLDHQSLSHSSTFGSSNIVSIHGRGRRHTQSTPTHTWDGFVRHGTRFKSFLDGAMLQVRSSSGTKRTSDILANSVDEDDEDHERYNRRRRVMVEDNKANTLAREKVAEVLELEQQLNDAQAQASALKAANESMRKDASSSQQRLDRTLEALRLAGSNAANARADADAAEATAASLAHTLQSLQMVVTETKQAAQVLHGEHQEVADAAASIGATLVQKEADLARSLKELKSLRSSNDELQTSRQTWEASRMGLERSVETQKLELNRLQREAKEREVLEVARKERADKVEQELQTAQALLLEATTGQEHAALTKAALEETLLNLQKANQGLHQHLTHVQESASKECERLCAALCIAEKELEALRMDSEVKQEELRRHELDKEGAEKQISQLKGRLSTMERRFQDTSSTGSFPREGPPTSTSNDSGSFAFTLPSLNGDPLSFAQSGPSHNTHAGTCSICFKASFGIMKACQCGKSLCAKRAHVSCVNRIHPGPSVSHPGTPAPRLPIVLCSTSWTPMMKK